MRVKNAVLVGAIFGTAAATSWFVVRQFPGEGQVSPPAAEPATATAAVPAAPARTPALSPPATEADGLAEIRVSAGGEPLSGAEVRLYAERPAPDAPGEIAFLDAGRATSDADGIARVPAAPGTYLVAARAKGLAPARATLFRARGEPATHLDLGLAPAVALEGRAAARDGAQVAARVVVFPDAGRGAFAPPAAPVEEQAATVTDATGAFRVDGLGPGAYAVEVEADGMHPALLPRVVLPRAAPLAVVLEPLGAVEGTVTRADGRGAAGARVRAFGAEHSGAATAGPDGRFTLRLPAGTYRVVATLEGLAGAAGQVVSTAGVATPGPSIRLGPGATVEGSVVDAASGEAIGGAEVALFPHETPAVAARAIAAPDGRFRVDGLAPGAYDLRAAARGRSPGILDAVTVAAGARFAATVRLAGTGAIEGVVRGDAGAPLASARILVAQRGDGWAGAIPIEARTDFEGRYRIDGLEVGRAELIAHEEGVALGVSRAVRVAEGRVGRADFFLPGTGYLAGRVTPAAGPSAVVATPMRAGLGGPQSARTLADATGNFRLALPAGEYRVHAAPADAFRTDLRVAPAFARVEAGRVTRLDLARAAVAEERGLEIQVLEPGGAPSAGAVVTLARAGDDRIALATAAGEDGRVVLAPESGPSGHPVSVHARNGGRTGAWSGTLVAGEVVTIPLLPGAAVEGTVRTAREERVDGFTLEVASQPAAGGWRTVDVHRFAGDRFELGDLPPEPVRLSVRTSDGKRGSADLLLRRGDVARVTVTVGAPAVAGAER